ADATSTNNNVSSPITGGTPYRTLFRASGSGAVTVHNGAVLDRETVENYTIVVTATDGGTPSLHTDQTVTVHLTDLNDNAPAFTTGRDISLHENTPGPTSPTPVPITHND